MANIDLIRLLVGDASETQLLTDDQITAIADGYTSDRLAAAAVADSIAALFSRKVSFSLEGLRFDNSQKAIAYRELAQRLRAEAANNEAGNMGMTISGVSIGEEQSVAGDDDRPASMFTLGMQKDPGI